MVDNRGISPVQSFSFKQGDASGMANKMSDEKMGQGGEYFQQEMQEEEQEDSFAKNFQDRSAQLRASLDSLAAVNVGSLNFKKILKNNKKNNNDDDKDKSNDEHLIKKIEEDVLDSW